MPRFAVALIVVLGIGTAGCQAAASPDDNPSLIEQRPVTPFVHELYTGFNQPVRTVVRDSRQWADVWASTFLARTEHPRRPSIDFSKEMVIVAAQGNQRSSGYDISIDSVASSAGTIVVNVTTTSPGERCVVLAVITSPIAMVRVPRLNARVRFVEHTRTAPCE